MYARILVPLDGSPTAERGLREAIEMARTHQSTLVPLHVIDAFPMMLEMASAVSYDESVASLKKFGTDLLDKAKARASEAGVSCDCVLREVTRQRVAEVIVEETTKNRCTLIVMGTHGRRGLSRIALGSAAEQVVRATDVPVLLVRDPGSV